jgi:4-hydroxy-3-polyprenylbenzoate decarboxylase
VRLVLAVTGATGARAAYLLARKSSWPVALVASEWGRKVYERECGPFRELEALADVVYDNSDLAAPISSGSVQTAGMVILPCSANTMAKVATGVADTLIARAAHCHLKEGRRLVLCVRESPWTLMDLDNARTLAAAGATIMPLSPPFYMANGKDLKTMTAEDLLEAMMERVLAVLGQEPGKTWETVA